MDIDFHKIETFPKEPMHWADKYVALEIVEGVIFDATVFHYAYHSECWCRDGRDKWELSEIEDVFTHWFEMRVAE